MSQGGGGQWWGKAAIFMPYWCGCPGGFGWPPNDTDPDPDGSSYILIYSYHKCSWVWSANIKTF